MIFPRPCVLKYGKPLIPWSSRAARAAGQKGFAMKNLAVIPALLLCLILAPAGCRKAPKDKAANAAATALDETEDLSETTPVNHRPRPWEQTYTGEAVIDMPAPAAQGPGP